MTRETIKNEKKTNAATFARLVFLPFVFLVCCAGFGYFLIDTTNAQETDFSRFKHSNPTHTRLPCLVCHVRSDNSPTMKYMGHIPCASCHTQQFAEGNKNPICTICHTTTGVKRFPSLKSFNARFDHAKHLKQANCASCHKPTRSGVGFSIPKGANAHTNCFSMSYGEFGKRDVFVRNLSSAGKPEPHFGMGKGLHDFVHAFKTSANDELRELSHGQSGFGTRQTGFFAAHCDALCAEKYAELCRLP